MSGQTPFTASLTLASNPEPRCPCVLVLDTSGSMAGEPIEQLQRGVQLLAEELSRDGLASKRVEIAVLAFGTQVRLLSGFVSPTTFTPPPACPRGRDPHGGGGPPRLRGA